MLLVIPNAKINMRKRDINRILRERRRYLKELEGRAYGQWWMATYYVDICTASVTANWNIARAKYIYSL